MRRQSEIHADRSRDAQVGVGDLQMVRESCSCKSGARRADRGRHSGRAETCGWAQRCADGAIDAQRGPEMRREGQETRGREQRRTDRVRDLADGTRDVQIG